MAKLKYLLSIAMILTGSLHASDERERKLIAHEEAGYPAIAAQMHLHGTVKLKIWIAPDGSVRRLEYVGGHPLLAESALKAVRGWKYDPNSKESTTVVEVRF